MRHVTDSERATRLATRHALAPSAYVATPEAATRAMTVLHATEPATVHLSCWARVPGYAVADLTVALEEDRSLVKQLAMRRTLFVFPRDLLPAAWGSASARVALAQRARLAKEAQEAGLADDGAAWLEEITARIRAVVAGEPDGISAAQLRARLPEELCRIPTAEGSAWLHTRVLTLMGASAELARGRNEVDWRAFRPRWTTASTWWGETPEPLDAREGYAVLVARWLRTFGPGTEEDVQWWLGATKTAVRTALADLDAVQVGLDGGATGWVLPDDLEPPTAPDGTEPWVALLPVLDPTVMGWKRRDFYLGRHGPLLFDRNGNAGTTAWVDGRIVGCWVQDDRARVRVRLLEDVGPRSRAALLARAEELTGWLEGQRVSTVYPSVAMKDPTVGTLL